MNQEEHEKKVLEDKNHVINVLDKCIDFVDKLIQLENLKSKPIPDYSKGKKHDGLMIFVQGNTKETIITPNGDIIRPRNKGVIISAPIGSEIYTTFDYEALFKEYKRIFDKLILIDKSVGHSTAGGGNYPSKGISDYWISFFNSNKVVSEGGRNSGRTHFYEEWSKQLNEHLRGKRVDISEPFAMAPIENVEVELERTLNGISKKCFIVDKKGDRIEIDEPFDWDKLVTPKPIDSLKTCLVNGIEHNLEYKGNGLYLIKDSVDNFQKGMLEADKELQKVYKTKHIHKFDNEQRIYEEGSGQLINVIKHCDCGEKSWYNKEEIQQKQQECLHENVDLESYRYGLDTKTLAISTCADCGLNLNLQKHTRLKNRQAEIGKEIEKLRTEAREIKNSLKH